MASVTLSLVNSDWGEPHVEATVRLEMTCSASPKLATLFGKLRQHVAYQNAAGQWITATGGTSPTIVFARDRIIDTEGGTSPSTPPLQVRLVGTGLDGEQWAKDNAPAGAVIGSWAYYVVAEGKGYQPCQTSDEDGEWFGPAHGFSM